MSLTDVLSNKRPLSTKSVRKKKLECGVLGEKLNTFLLQKVPIKCAVRCQNKIFCSNELWLYSMQNLILMQFDFGDDKKVISFFLNPSHETNI